MEHWFMPLMGPDALPDAFDTSWLEDPLAAGAVAPLRGASQPQDVCIDAGTPAADNLIRRMNAYVAGLTSGIEHPEGSGLSAQDAAELQYSRCQREASKPAAPAARGRRGAASGGAAARAGRGAAVDLTHEDQPLEGPFLRGAEVLACELDRCLCSPPCKPRDAATLAGRTQDKLVEEQCVQPLLDEWKEAVSRAGINPSAPRREYRVPALAARRRLQARLDEAVTRAGGTLAVAAALRERRAARRQQQRATGATAAAASSGTEGARASAGGGAGGAAYSAAEALSDPLDVDLETLEWDPLAQPALEEGSSVAAPPAAKRARSAGGEAGRGGKARRGRPKSAGAAAPVRDVGDVEAALQEVEAIIQEVKAAANASTDPADGSHPIIAGISARGVSADEVRANLLARFATARWWEGLSTIARWRLQTPDERASMVHVPATAKAAQAVAGAGPRPLAAGAVPRLPGAPGPAPPRPETLYRIAVMHHSAPRRSQEFLVLGSNTLASLKDCLYCLRDQTHGGASRGASFFFIEGVLYDDTRAGKMVGTQLAAANLVLGGSGGSGAAGARDAAPSDNGGNGASSSQGAPAAAAPGAGAVGAASASAARSAAAVAVVDREIDREVAERYAGHAPLQELEAAMRQVGSKEGEGGSDIEGAEAGKRGGRRRRGKKGNKEEESTRKVGRRRRRKSSSSSSDDSSDDGSGSEGDGAAQGKQAPLFDPTLPEPVPEELGLPVGPYLSAEIVRWSRQAVATKRATGWGLLQAGSMEETRFSELGLRLGAHYLYCHQGDCEHIIIVTEARLLSSAPGVDLLDARYYPRLAAQYKLAVAKCDGCEKAAAAWEVFGGPFCKANPSLYCDACRHHLYGTAAGAGGALGADFYVMPYLHEDA